MSITTVPWYCHVATKRSAASPGVDSSGGFRFRHPHLDPILHPEVLEEGTVVRAHLKYRPRAYAEGEGG